MWVHNNRYTGELIAMGDHPSSSAPQISLPVIVPRGDLTLQIVIWEEDQRGERIISHGGGVVAILKPHFNCTSLISEAILSDNRVQHQLHRAVQVTEEKHSEEVREDGSRG
jgi:hypothetical protein